MALYDFSAPRLFVEPDLGPGAEIELDRAQANYLLNVLRLGPGKAVLAFNGRDGEWLMEIRSAGRKSASLVAGERTRPQPEPGNLAFLFAPLKHARLDYTVQKAVEMGVGRLQPTFTRRTVSSRVNAERMRANAIEAAEQCGILAVPEVAAEDDLEPVLRRLEPERVLVFCDEDAPLKNPLEALAALPPGTRLALLVGPEGGFAPEERAMLLARPNVLRISLGPRILRADTAAVAALAILQAAIGDWR
ncbi:MAG: rRNA ((1498)-N(3))-methyltransferase [Enterovirga sp.]|nr:rRNA ((1498)-N(3))-methyltransferase [Enterovirga sp.]